MAMIPTSLQTYAGFEEAELELLKTSWIEGLPSDPLFVTDFLGGKTRAASLYDGAAAMVGHVQGPPLGGDWHAEAVEWIGLIKAVRAATGTFTVMEWGAGWGPWMVSGGIAARNRGITDIRLYGVEADPSHFAALVQHAEDNGFPDAVLIQAAVGVYREKARWPCHPDPRNDWGTRPIRPDNTSDDDYNGGRIQKFIDVDIMCAADLLAREDAWDLIHIDIQGWEADVCSSVIDILSKKTRFVIIGTHSRPVETQLLKVFHRAGWLLENEKPCKFRYSLKKEDFASMVIVNGTQVWRNPAL